jgi:hypothetical protein
MRRELLGQKPGEASALAGHMVMRQFYLVPLHTEIAVASNLPSHVEIMLGLGILGNFGRWDVSRLMHWRPVRQGARMAAGLSAFGGKDGSWAGVRICPSMFQEVYIDIF